MSFPAGSQSNFSLVPVLRGFVAQYSLRSSFVFQCSERGMDFFGVAGAGG